MQQYSTKILIVGGGPGGATLSLFLTKHKIQHILVDKAVFPRDKVCGDCLTQEVPYVLRKISQELMEEYLSATDKFLPNYGGKLIAESGRGYEIAFEKDELYCAPFYSARREVFDDWLFQKTKTEYATVLENCSIDLVEDLGNCIRATGKHNGAEVEIEAELIVGGDGERSVVKKHLHPNGITKAHEHYAGAIRAYYKGVTGVSDKGQIELFHLAEILPGYFWIFPLPNGEVNVGVGLLSSEISKRNFNLRKFMDDTINNHPAIKDRFKNAERLGPVKGWGIPTNSKKEITYGNRFILIGDAGSLAEPYTGKGIGIAMASSMIAAEFIVKNLDSDFSAQINKAYYETIERRYRKEWNWLIWFQNRCRKRWFTELFPMIYSFGFVNKMMKRVIKKGIQKYLVDHLN